MWSCNPIMIYRVIVGGPHPSSLPVVRREYQEKTRVKCAKGSITRSRRSIIREFVIATYIISRPLDRSDRTCEFAVLSYTSSNVHFPCNCWDFHFCLSYFAVFFRWLRPMWHCMCQIFRDGSWIFQNAVSFDRQRSARTTRIVERCSRNYEEKLSLGI